MDNFLLNVRRLVGLPILITGVGITLVGALIVKIGAYLSSIEAPTIERPTDLTDDELEEVIRELNEARSHQDKD